jgi:chorismate mutase
MVASLLEETSMDNRLNKIRKDMSALRADMLRLEGVIRDQINRDRDCTESTLRLMAMRREICMLVAEWRQLGGIADLPTVEERLKGRRVTSRRARSVRLPMLGKRHAARA